MSNVQKTDAIQKADTPKPMKAWVSEARNAFAMVLPKALTPERFVRIAQSALVKSPDLAQCHPSDLIIALLNVAQLGLEPNTPLGHAYLIPYWSNKRSCFEPQVILGYQGILHLVWHSGVIDGLAVELAYANDVFRVVKGSKPEIVHEPNLDAPDRGPLRGGYMVTHVKGAAMPMLHSMSVADFTRIRDKFGNKRGNVWRDHFEAMCLKTVVRHGSKLLPKAPESPLARAVQIDERTERGARNPLLIGDNDTDRVFSTLPRSLGVDERALQSDDDERDDDSNNEGVHEDRHQRSGPAPVEALKARLGVVTSTAASIDPPAAMGRNDAAAEQPKRGPRTQRGFVDTSTQDTPASVHDDPLGGRD